MEDINLSKNTLCHLQLLHQAVRGTGDNTKQDAACCIHVGVSEKGLGLLHMPSHAYWTLNKLLFNKINNAMSALL